MCVCVCVWSFITYIHRLIGVDSGRWLLFPAHYFHNKSSGQVFKLFGHDDLVKVRLLHYKVKAMLLDKGIKVKDGRGEREE